MEININNISYTYNKQGNLSELVLKNITTIFKNSKIHGITGPSGSGKTTLLEIINALRYVDDGIITIGDYKLAKNISKNKLNDLRTNIGLVFQFPEEQFFNSTVKKEIGFALRKYNYKEDYINKKIKEVLKMIGLNDDYLNLNPFYLSNGEKRRIAIASILVFNPKVILLDEPTVGLDYRGKKQLINLVKRLIEKYNKNIIICTHDIDFLYQIADNIIVLVNGRIIIESLKKDIFKNISLFNKYNIKLPKIVEFINKVDNNKGIKLEETININDLIKDIYRNV